MNEIEHDNHSQKFPELPKVDTAKPKRTRKPKARAARVIDPEVAAIRRQAKEQVRQLKLARNSGRVLATITDKLLPKLTDEHKGWLHSTLHTLISAASAPAQEPTGPVEG